VRIVELRWQVRGEIAADYAYPLFSAVCRRLETRLHDADAEWTMSPVIVEDGDVVGDQLVVRRGMLCIRCDRELVTDFAGLYARSGLAVYETGALKIGQDPTIHVLQPARALHAERVTIKGASEGTSDLGRRLFRSKIEQRLQRHQVRYTSLRIGAPFSLRIADQWSCGFAVEIDGLSDDDSLYLQAAGLGGRRRMGCGFMRV
jgi:CRISPR-associated protein Cas6